MSNTQPEALRLAHTLSGGKLIDDSTEWADTLYAAAAKLHHQHTRIEELEAQLAATQSAAQGWKLVPVELLERIQESLGSYLSDHGWSQSDMDTADALDGLLARDLVEDTDPDDVAFDDFAEDVEKQARKAKPVEDGWLQDEHMLYRLTDEPRPRNRDEIIVTMVNGSRAEAARTKRASEILYAIRTAEAGKVMK